ncbi:GNAT family N-acetyltransferase, partial [Verrucomicrobiota bacterium]
GLGFDEHEQKHIRLAIEELFAFINHTALVGQNTLPVTLSFEPKADGLVLRIIEKGLPLDIEHMPSYSPGDNLADAQPESLSLFLAKKVMDNIVFVNHGRGGIEIKMLKRRAGSHIQKLMADTPAETEPEHTTPRQTQDFTIRPARESEALEISRCAFLTYGYTYEDYIYYPERIIEMNRSGELHSLVAVTHEGKIMGHCALKFVPPRLKCGELGVLFVKPEFRRQGLGSALWKAAVDYAREMKLDSMFARSVTGHRASQAIAEHNGFSDCALSLALFPHAVNLKDMGGTQAGKMSGMLQWLKLSDPGVKTIHPPACYIDIIKELYKRAGIPVAVGNTISQPQSTEDPLLRIERLPILNVGILEIESIGPDAKSAACWAEQHCRRLCGEKFDVIYLFINIEQPGAADVADHCARRGFILSGIAPGAFPNNDAVVLQYLNLPDDPFANMTTWTDTSALLRDFIYKEWQTQNT